MIYIREAKHLGGYRLELTFSDGSSCEVDFEPLLERPFFAPLRDEALFAKAFADGYTVAWPGNLDIAPEALYALAHGLPHAKTAEQADANELAVSLRQVKPHARPDHLEAFEMSGLDEEARARIERGEEGDVAVLRRYVEALGGKLEISAVFGDTRIELHGVRVRSWGYEHEPPSQAGRGDELRVQSPSAEHEQGRVHDERGDDTLEPSPNE